MDKFLLTYLNEIPSKEEIRFEAIHEILPYPNENYSNEGSEFLDDAIRTHDQPLIYTEESVAAGSPRYLL